MAKAGSRAGRASRTVGAVRGSVVARHGVLGLLGQRPVVVRVGRVVAEAAGARRRVGGVVAEATADAAGARRRGVVGGAGVGRVAAGEGVLGLLGHRPVVTVGGVSVATVGVVVAEAAGGAVTGSGAGRRVMGASRVGRVASGQGVLELLTGSPVVAVGVVVVADAAADTGAVAGAGRRGRGVAATGQSVAELLTDAAASRRRVGAMSRAREGRATVGTAVGAADGLLLV